MNDRRPGSPTAETVADAGDGWIGRARAIAPLIEAAGVRIDAACRLPDDVLAALRDARLFRLLMPRWLDGGEVDLATHAQVLEAVARADASTAWCLGQNAGCTMSAAYLDPAVAREIFGPPDAAAAWGAGAQGRAVKVAGGVRVTGRWMFASGSRHATWLGGHCRLVVDGEVQRDAAGRPLERTAFFRREAAGIDDDWQVLGLRGTGSDSYAVEDLFVPDSHLIARDDPAAVREPGTLYRFPTTLAFAAGFGGVSLGVARSLLDPLLGMARGKTPRGVGRALAADPVFQALAARLEGRLGAARAYLLHTLRQAWQATEAAGRLELASRMAIRLAATFAINEATEVSYAAYRAAGSTAIFESQPFERRFRDAHAVSQQLQGRPSHFETVGRYLLGHDPDTLEFV